MCKLRDEAEHLGRAGRGRMAIVLSVLTSLEAKLVNCCGLYNVAANDAAMSKTLKANCMVYLPGYNLPGYNLPGYNLPGYNLQEYRV